MRKRAQRQAIDGNLGRWLDLQRDMQSVLEARLRERLAGEPPALARYRRAYERQFPDWTGRVLSPHRLTARLREAGVVLVGDFHSLAQSQRTAMRLLRRLVRAGARPVLALETIPAENQTDLEDHLAGRLSEAAFLARMDYARRWGFAWGPTRVLLAYARRQDLPVVGLNSLSGAGPGALGARDRRAAALLAAQRRDAPDRPVLALVGDYHLAATHLPAALDAALAGTGDTGRVLRVFQNHEPLYWRSLAARGRFAEILELDGGDLLIQSATPFVKMQSYLHWLTFRPWLASGRATPPDPGELQEDLGPEIDAAMTRIARYLRIPMLSQAPPRVYWIGQADFALRVARASGWREDEIALAQASLSRGEDCYLPDRDLALLGEINQNRIAEMAARVLHARSAGLRPRPRTLADDFYLRVLRQALVFLGSKVINPLRKSQDMAVLQRLLAEGGAGRWKRRAELLLAYLVAEERFLADGDPDRFVPRFFRLDAETHLDLTTAIGRHLGCRLYDALIQDAFDRFWLRELYFEPFHLEGSPVRAYFDIMEHLGATERAGGLRRRQTERL